MAWLKKLVLPALAAAFIMGHASNASAIVLDLNCDGWSAAFHWGSNVYMVATANLYKLNDGGTWDLVETKVDGQFLPAAGDILLGTLWDSPLDGTYIVGGGITVYYMTAPPASQADIDAVPPHLVWNYTFEQNGLPTPAPFVCESPRISNAARTPGYWKNHPEAWGATELSVGGTTYDQACLLDFFDTPTQGDVRVILIHHLLAAKLNLLDSPIDGIGSTDPNTVTGYPDADSTVSDTIAAADAYLAGVTINCADGTLSGSKPTGGAKGVGAALKDALDAYNNNATDVDSSSTALMAEDEAGGCTSVGGRAGLASLALPLLAGMMFVRIRRRR